MPKYMNEMDENGDVNNESKESENEIECDDEGNRDYDTEIALFYHCKCNKLKDKKCDCSNKKIERRSFECILKQRKRNGIKHKPQWIKQRERNRCANLKHRKAKSKSIKKKKIDLQIKTMPPGLIMPATRRGAKSISAECVTPFNNEIKRKI